MVKKTIYFFLILFLFLCWNNLFAEEKITLTTYYPAPYGAYQKIVVGSLGVGDNNADGVIDDADGPNPETNGGDIWIGGNVGIGTVSPEEALHVVGDVKVVGDVRASGQIYLDNNLPRPVSLESIGDVSWDMIANRFCTTGSIDEISSRRYKENIQPLEDDFDKILELNLKSFNYRESGAEDIGYIAEEVDELGLKRLVIYDEEGRPNALHYDKFPLYMLEVMKTQHLEIEELSAKLNEFEEQQVKIEQLSKKVEELENQQAQIAASNEKVKQLEETLSGKEKGIFSFDWR